MSSQACILKALPTSRLQVLPRFHDPALEPGVTAVVGPNGCGKSNIADSIRWVLGEQSAKALRGGKMQDVIFEGTDTRRPSQLCEAALLLTDCENQLGSEFHEIEIMRRVHRDGQGEYFFNGQPCRLKDIQKLFMDTGIGRSSYSVMAQGQIDQILSSKPEDRRAVFEEAAGITKYKSQRREALNKLALTDQNLVRVADVVGEVGRQIGSLRRQAAKAMRYKRLSHRLRHLSLASSGRQHIELTAELGRLEARVAELRTAADERRARLEARQSGVDEQKAQRSRLNQRVQDAQQAVFDLRSQARRRRIRRISPTPGAGGWRSGSTPPARASAKPRCSFARSPPRWTRARRTSSSSSISSAAPTRSSSSATARSPSPRERSPASSRSSSRRNSSSCSSTAPSRGCAPTAPATRSSRRPACTGTRP